MPNEVRLPKWFLVMKAMCKELFISLSCVFIFLQTNIFDVKEALGGIYVTTKLIFLFPMLFCGGLSCEDWLKKFKNGSK